MMELRERYHGCLLGLAAGDALGTTLEFRTPGSFAPITDMIGGGPFQLRAGEWTDDTSMALCLAESLLACGGFDARDQMDRYRRWYREGYMSSTGRCFDIGNTVRQALHTFESTGEPVSGPTAPNTAGNGSIMRLAPIPLYYLQDPATALKRSRDSSTTTHGASAAVDASEYLGCLLIGALRGIEKSELLSADFSSGPTWHPDRLCGPVKAIVEGSFREKQPPQVRGTGYVIESLEAALWAFNESSTFEEGALLAVNLGDDADTTGAVFGQLAGAYYGVGGIPQSWRDKLAQLRTLESVADRLLDAGTGGTS
jgi:ADP-ribosylglycohydrolase